jgi:hypothetical protein
MQHCSIGSEAIMLRLEISMLPTVLFTHRRCLLKIDSKASRVVTRKLLFCVILHRYLIGHGLSEVNY